MLMYCPAISSSCCRVAKSSMALITARCLLYVAGAFVFFSLCYARKISEVISDIKVLPRWFSHHKTNLTRSWSLPVHQCIYSSTNRLKGYGARGYPFGFVFLVVQNSTIAHVLASAFRLKVLVLMPLPDLVMMVRCRIPPFLRVTVRIWKFSICVSSFAKK